MATKNDQDKDFGEITIVNVRQNLVDSIERVFGYFRDFMENPQNIPVSMSDKSESVDFASEWADTVQNQISVLKALLATAKKAADISSEVLSESDHVGISEETIYDHEVAQVGLNEIQKNILSALLNRQMTLSNFGRPFISIHEGIILKGVPAHDQENEEVPLTGEEVAQKKLLEIQALSGDLSQNFLGAIGYIANEINELEVSVVSRIKDHLRQQEIIETFGLSKIGDAGDSVQMLKSEFTLKANRLLNAVSNLEAVEGFIRDRLPKQTLN